MNPMYNGLDKRSKMNKDRIRVNGELKFITLLTQDSCEW